MRLDIKLIKLGGTTKDKPFRPMLYIGGMAFQMEIKFKIKFNKGC